MKLHLIMEEKSSFTQFLAEWALVYSPEYLGVQLYSKGTDDNTDDWLVVREQISAHNPNI